MINHISDGDFKGYKLKFTMTGKLVLSNIHEYYEMNRQTVESVTPLGANSSQTTGKTSGSIGRAIVGGAIAGPLGALVGAGTAKTKATSVVNSYDICVILIDGRKFTCEVDKNVYMAFMNI